MDDGTLIELIRGEYGLPVGRLTYLKPAWVAHCYAVDCVPAAEDLAGIVEDCISGWPTLP